MEPCYCQALVRRSLHCSCWALWRCWGVASPCSCVALWGFDWGVYRCVCVCVYVLLRSVAVLGCGFSLPVCGFVRIWLRCVQVCVCVRICVNVDLSSNLSSIYAMSWILRAVLTWIYILYTDIYAIGWILRAPLAVPRRRRRSGTSSGTGIYI